MFTFRTALACVLIAMLAAPPATAGEHYAKAAPVELTKEERRWAEQTLKKLSLEEKVGQMLGVRYYMDFENFSSDAYQQFRAQMQKYHLGHRALLRCGWMAHFCSRMLRGSCHDVQPVATRFQAALLISADFERGLAMRMNEVPVFP